MIAIRVNPRRSAVGFCARHSRCATRLLWIGLIAPGPRLLAGQSRNVRASFAEPVRAPQASCAPSARPCALLCGAEDWSHESHAHAYQGLQTESCRERTIREPARK